MGSVSKKDVVEYYNTSQWLYSLFCYDQRSLGMHFGFWDGKTKNHHDAILHENQVVSDTAGIKKGMKVLDAGCGVGGTALYIAGHTGAHVWGISITPKQIVLANSYAKKRHLEDLTTFSVQDYTKTNFPNSFFDVIVGLESICCASPKSTFLKEAYRILKPGGKLVIADGYMGRYPKNRKEEDIINGFKWAFALNEFITEEEMTTQIKQSGFTHVKAKNMLKEVKRSVEYYMKLAKYTSFICKLTKYLPFPYLRAIYQNYIALQTTADGYPIGLAGYFVHSAEKPFDKLRDK